MRQENNDNKRLISILHTKQYQEKIKRQIKRTAEQAFQKSSPCEPIKKLVFSLSSKVEDDLLYQNIKINVRLW